MKIPTWLIRNLPTIARIVVRLVESRPAKGNFKKTGVLFLALSMTTCATLRDQVDDFCKRNPRECNGPIQSPPPATLPPQPAPSPLPVPTPEPSPSVEPTPAPSPSPSATPVPSPSPSPCVQTCAAPPAGYKFAEGVSPFGYGPEPGACYEPVKIDINTRENPPVDDSITWTKCDTCTGRREWEKKQGNWIDEGRRDGWYRANAIGSPMGDKFVTKECDLVTEGGALVHARNSGFLGQICPRKVGNAGPCPSPAPTPVPSPTPTPNGTPALTESGNYPVPVGSCPTWFRDAVSEVGIGVLTQRKCAGRDAPPDCTLTVLSATEKSVKPYCEHSCYDEAGRYNLANCRNRCETVRVCQQPEFVNGNGGVKMQIASPEWGNVFGDCDKQTSEGPFPDNRRNFLCHDRAENRAGVTQAKACEPDMTKCGPTITFRSLP